ncbi:3,4-dihydroxy-2-butanone-4-phosphate synthase [uncultured Methanofollis sp.]|uniref:3,4-dihydroxy-2-butanone-4-phosphate synthase n=1 Tax=uncultured Methanofollis sp. TaxID=262500 RepID=UPI00260210EB|nr:3,4-dihydroxy-2-butanone-4-phosphate synthase [uncultured Methanofollis sp.]
MIEDACAALKAGKFILLYDFDDRERETDLVICADAVTPHDVMTMRKDGGGLICTAVHPEAAKRLGLPFASDLLRDFDAVEHLGDIPYDRKNHSSFSIWVNHRSTYTGIPDRDRATTINAIADQVKKSLNGGGQNFKAEFRTPGHVALLRAAEGLLDVRRGQTELSIALAAMAGVTPALVVCEMLDDETGLALSKEGAQAYARDHGLVFIEGKEVLEHWKGISA